MPRKQVKSLLLVFSLYVARIDNRDHLHSESEQVLLTDAILDPTHPKTTEGLYRNIRGMQKVVVTVSFRHREKTSNGNMVLARERRTGP